MSFLYPEILLLIIVPIVMDFYLFFSKKGKFDTFFDREILNKLTKSAQSSFSTKVRVILLAFSVGLMIVALARPVVEGGNKEIKSKGMEVAVLLDISKSMLSKDLYPNRLENAKRKIKDLLDLSSNDRFSIIGFAGGSFLVTPMTQDKETIKYLLDSMDTTTISKPGSNLSGAILAATNSIKSQEKTLLILSDGTDEDIQKIIDEIKDLDIRIYAIGFGSLEGSAIELAGGELLKDKNENIVITKRNENFYKIALNKGGAYMDSTMDAKDVKSIYEHMKTNLSSVDYEKRKIKEYMELFYYPLILALVLMYLTFHTFSKRVVASIFVLFISFNSDLYALTFDFEKVKQADEAYKNKEYQKAYEIYSQIEDASESQNSMKFYNMGNAKYKLEKYEEAIKEYEESLKLHDNEDTKYNLELAKKKLKEQQEKEKEKNKDQNKQDQNKQDENKQKEDKQDKNEESGKKEKEDSKNKKEESSKNDEENKNKEQKDSKQQQEEDNREISAREEKNWMGKLKSTTNPLGLKELKTKGSSDEKTW